MEKTVRQPFGGCFADRSSRFGGMAGDPQLFGCQNAGKGTPAGGGVVGGFCGVIIGFGICAGVICFQFCESNPQGGILEIHSCDGIHPDGV